MVRRWHRMAWSSTAWLALMVLALFAGCDDDEGNSEGNAGGLDGDWTIEDGDMEQGELALPDEHEPVTCDWNACLGKNMKEGGFCLEDLSVDGDEESAEPPMILVTCGTAENDCIVETNREDCAYGCDLETSLCRPEPGHILGTVTREATPVPAVEGGAEASVFSGKLWINVFNAPRDGMQMPEDCLVAIARISDVDLTNDTASVPFDQVLLHVSEFGGTLPAGTYYVDAWLTASDVEGEDALHDGDLIQQTQQQVTADEEGNIQVDIHLDASWDDALLTR